MNSRFISEQIIGWRAQFVHSAGSSCRKFDNSHHAAPISTWNRDLHPSDTQFRLDLVPTRLLKLSAVDFPI